MAEEKKEGFLPPYRVLDLTDEKGDFCAKLLADMGADVIRVEPTSGNKTRHRGPFFNDEPHPEKSLYFLYYNTNKKSVTLNLENEDGKALFLELVKTADALVESFPVGYLKSLGLDYEVLSQVNPRMVMASITPFGQTGPCKDYKTSDIVDMALSGYMQITGEPEFPPVRLGNEQSHFAPSQFAATGMLAALYYRDFNAGEGQYIDVSMHESLICYYLEQSPAQLWLHKGENVTRVGNISTLLVPCGLYPCADGWVSIALMTAAEWESQAQWMYEVTGNELVLDEKYKGGVHARAPYLDEVTAFYMDFTTRLTREELFHEGQKRNIGYHPVYEISDLLKDRQLESNEFWEELDHPVVGKMKYPMRLFYGEDIPYSACPAPLLGEHNEDIYCNDLGLSKEDLVALRSGGVI